MSTPDAPQAPARRTWLERARGRLFHTFFLLTRPMTLGVRGVAFDADRRVLLVRHGYVRGWHFPGGGVESGETCEQALKREMREEACVAVDGPMRLHGLYFNAHVSRRDHVAVYVIDRYRVTAERAPDYEIQEARFFPLDALPEDINNGARARLEEICHGAVSAREARERPVLPALRGWLSTEQLLALDSLAPTEFILPNKKRPAVLRYTADGQCIVSAKVQEFYDADPKKLRILGGTFPVTLEILAPNYRPVQITTDLAAFWANSYEQVKKDLRGRYPRHEWR